MFQLNEGGEPVVPRDAATLLVLRAVESGASGVEVFCVRRHAKSAFMGGAVVFPGGKLDAADGAASMQRLASGSHDRATLFADSPKHAHALAVCACRESLEEAAILPCNPPLGAKQLAEMRVDLAAGSVPSFAALLEREGVKLNTSALVPFAHWVTPQVEQRRYDARFFVTRLPPGQVGAHDTHETTSSVWARPQQLLDANAAGDLFLAPPTMRSLEILAPVQDVDAAIALCASQSLLAVCPQFVPGDPPMLTLPGDPLHDVQERRVAGPTRVVLRDGRFVSENPT